MIKSPAEALSLSGAFSLPLHLLHNTSECQIGGKIKEIINLAENTTN
jgi:hypothetical protein